MIPGEYQLAEGDILANVGRKNRKNRSNQFQATAQFKLARITIFLKPIMPLNLTALLARGMRLNVPSGNAVRFEPGEAKTVELVAFGGSQTIYGFHNQIDGKL